jgi:hypothetical protein
VHPALERLEPIRRLLHKQQNSPHPTLVWMQLVVGAHLPCSKESGLRLQSLFVVQFIPARDVQLTEAGAQLRSKDGAWLLPIQLNVEPSKGQAPLRPGKQYSQTVAQPEVAQLVCATELVLQRMPANASSGLTIL